MYIPSLTPTRRLTVDIASLQRDYEVTSVLWSSYTGTYQQAYVWGLEPTHTYTVYYYFDPDYSTANVEYVSWVGFPYHLREVMAYRGLPMEVKIINAAQLRSLVTNASTVSDSFLVMASGAFPSTVFTKHTNLVAPWIQQGGRLFWIGAAIGYYVSEPGVPIDYPPSTSSPGRAGVSQFLDPSILGGPTAYYNSTVMSTILNIDLTSGLDGGLDFNISSLIRAGGEVLGNEADGYTNGALVPFGTGFLVDFAGTVATPLEADLATGLVNTLQLGLLGGSVQVLGYRNVVAPAGDTLTWAESIPFPTGKVSGRRFCVFTAQTDLTAFFANVTCA